MRLSPIPILIALPALLAAQPAASVLEGVVVNSLSGQPLRHATVALVKENGGERVAATATEANGTFQLRTTEPGRYLIFAQRTGYDARFYTAAQRNTRSGTAISIGAGTAVRDLTVRLNPRAAVAGRVTDEEGEPVANATVVALHTVYLRGRRQWMPAGQATTDDVGEYRIFDLEQGAYILRASAEGQPAGVTERGIAFVPVYYPNAAGADSAAPLPLGAGQAARGMDFQLRRERTFSVSGRVQGTGHVVISLAPVSASGVVELREKRPVPVRNDRFEISAVLPGRYAVLAEQFGETAGLTASGRVELDVADDVRGVEIPLWRAESVSGRVVIEGDGVKLPDHLQIALQPDADALAAANASLEEGSRFQWRTVLPGRYQVAVNGAPDAVYLKSVRAGDADVLRDGLDYSRGVYGGEIVIVLSAAGGTLRGAVKTDAGTAPGGSQVVAIADNGRVRAAITDQAGQFELRGLAPGAWHVLAFEELEAGAAEDAQFMQRFAGKSRSVTVTPRGTESIELTVIPAELSQPGL